MPTFGFWCVILALFGLYVGRANAPDLVQGINGEEDIKYCELGQRHGEEVSRFFLGTGPAPTAYDVCNQGHYFNYNPADPKKVTCKKCSQGTYSKRRNFCPQCDSCTVCNEHQVQIERCRTGSDTVCAEKTTTLQPSNLTAGSQPNSTTDVPTTEAEQFTTTELVTSSECPCPKCPSNPKKASKDCSIDGHVLQWVLGGTCLLLMLAIVVLAICLQRKVRQLRTAAAPSNSAQPGDDDTSAEAEAAAAAAAAAAAKPGPSTPFLGGSDTSGTSGAVGDADTEV